MSFNHKFSLLAFVVILTSCIKRPPDGPKTSGSVVDKNTTSLTIYFKSDPMCDAAAIFSLFKEDSIGNFVSVSSQKYEAYYRKYFKNLPPLCESTGTLVFMHLSAGNYRIEYSDCFNLHYEEFKIKENCKIWTPQENNADTVNVTIFSSRTDSLIVTVSRVGYERTRILVPSSGKPIDCTVDSIYAHFKLPAEEYDVTWGSYNNYEFQQKRSFHFNCNILEIN